MISVGAAIIGAKNYSLTHKIEREELPSLERPDKSPIKTEKTPKYKPYSSYGSNYSNTPSSKPYGSNYSKSPSSRSTYSKPYGSRSRDVTNNQKSPSYDSRYNDARNTWKSNTPGSTNVPKKSGLDDKKTHYKCPYCGGSVIKNVCSLCGRTYNTEDYWW